MLLSERMKAQGNIWFRWRSYLPLLLAPAGILAAMEAGYFERWLGKGLENAWDIFAVLVSFLGLFVRILVVGYAPRGTSGRGTRKQRADHLNTTGMYSLTRNPLYLGNFLILLGFAIAVKVWWFALLAAVAFSLYYERIILAEEAYLGEKFGSGFQDWVRRTPTFFPRLGRWERPEVPFSLRTILRREYHGFYLIVIVQTAIEIITDLMGDGEPLATFLGDDRPWLYFLGAGTLIYLALRCLHKYTRLLRVPGR